MSEMDLSIKLRAEGGKKIAAEVGQLGRHFKGLSGEINKTFNVAGKVKNLFNLNKQFNKSAGQIAKSKIELTHLRKEIKLVDSPSKKLLKTFKEKEKQLGKLVNAQHKEKLKLKELAGELKKAGINTKNLRKENNKYARSVEEATRKLSDFTAKQKQIQQTKTRKLQNTANLGFVSASMLATGRILARVASPISKIKQVEKSKSELQSIMGENGKADAQKIVDEGRKMSNKIAGITSANFTGAAYTIKSSMSSLSAGAVADMTSAAAITAKASKSDLATMTELYAKGSGVFKTHLFKDMSDSEFGNVFGSAIARTVQNFNTTGLKMASAIRTAGEGASMAGISMGEQLAVLGMAQQVLTAEQAGTAYMALLSNPAAAQEKLAKAGYGAELLREDGNVKSMPEMLAALEQTFSDDLSSIEQGILSQAFGEEAMKMLKNAWGKGVQIQKNATDINATSAKGIDFALTMMNRMQDNFSDKWDIQRQRWNAIQEQIGEALLPILEAMMPALEELGTWVSGFIKDNKGATGKVAAAVLAFAGVLGAAGGLFIAVASLTGAAASASAALSMLSLNAKMAGAAVGMGGVTGTAKKAGFGATLAANAKGGWWKGLGGIGKATTLLTASVSAYQLQDSWRDDKKTRGEALDDTTEIAGGLGGMWAGAAAGAAMGSFVPFIGTAIGGLAGGLAGYYSGSALGDIVGNLWKTGNKDNKQSELIFNELVSKDIIDHDAIGNSEINNWQALEALSAEKLKALVGYDDFSNADTKRIKALTESKLINETTGIQQSSQVVNGGINFTINGAQNPMSVAKEVSRKMPFIKNNDYQFDTGID